MQNRIKLAKAPGNNGCLVRYVLCKKLMATYNPSGAYLESKLLSASPLELVCLAYEGIIEAIQLARVCVREKRIHDRSRAITKAQLLIGELQRSLDFSHGGEMSPQLARLYTYMRKCLLDANFRQVEEPLAEVENLLETLLESWRELAEKEKSSLIFGDTSFAPQTAPLFDTSGYDSAAACDEAAYDLTGYGGSSFDAAYATSGYNAAYATTSSWTMPADSEITTFTSTPPVYAESASAPSAYGASTSTWDAPSNSLTPAFAAPASASSYDASAWTTSEDSATTVSAEVAPAYNESLSTPFSPYGGSSYGGSSYGSSSYGGSAWATPTDSELYSTADLTL